MTNDTRRIKEAIIFFTMIIATALCLSFIISVVLYRYGIPQHPHKYLLSSLYISVCVGLPVAVMASQNQFRLMLHRDPLETLSATDTLSGLLTRRFFLQAANQQIQLMNRTDKMSGLVVFDIDNFRAINDAYGSTLSDKVLVTVSNIAREELRSRQDLITRWWGDEFVIALYNSTAEQTLLVAERIRQRVAEMSVDLGGSGVSITASFGFAPLSKYDSLESALARADEAMQRAKDDGKNRICSWSMAKLGIDSGQARPRQNRADRLAAA